MTDLSELDDEHLATRCREGEEAAYGELVARYRESAYWVAWRVLGEHEEAKDVAQEAFLRVFRTLDRFDASKRFRSWFNTIVAHLSIDRLRKRKRRRFVSLDEVQEPSHPGEAPGRAAEQAEMAARVRAVLAELPEPYGPLLLQRDMERRCPQEMAREHGIPPATMRWRLHRARQLFRDAWERMYGGGDGQ